MTPTPPAFREANLIKWSDEIHALGIRKIDDQHKQLVGLINALDARRGSGDAKFITDVFATLIHYIKKHFADEERLLKRMSYRKFEDHHAQHARFSAALESFRQMFEKEGPSPELVLRLTKWLGEWLQQHILVEDKAYARDLFEE